MPKKTPLWNAGIALKTDILRETASNQRNSAVYYVVKIHMTPFLVMRSCALSAIKWDIKLISALKGIYRNAINAKI